MSVAEAFEFLDAYDGLLFVVGLATLLAIVLPRYLGAKPFSEPMAVVALGALVFALPIDLLPDPDPLVNREAAERLTELGVIIALMGAGLKLDRAPGRRAWATTWRLLGITMPLTIAAVALLGWAVAGLVPAAAVLLGACVAPTDPVLASEVQVGEPEGEHEGEDEVRVALTAEAGLNDGLAFPFTNMAIAMAVAGAAPSGWIGTWLTVHVVFKLGVGLVLGYAIGKLLGAVVLALPALNPLSKILIGLGAPASTLIAYGVTELASGYGFIAVFVAALVIRDFERSHDYHVELHRVSEMTERLLIALVLILFGGALVRGLLLPLTVTGAAVGVVAVLVVRPVAGWLGLLGSRRASGREKATISFFGIRGLGSLYYLSHALTEERFPGAEEIWAIVGFIVLLSIVVHGVTAAPVMSALDRRRDM